ncbi:uncharacterized protein LOC131640685 [Vicia villosa]|uniref:uncharacterized protein LOC131619067 n=1 Tax=Vicia villosa TaxID=3911 RepID=UPI00273B8577|nr:uncharacterized protein LOC131619067 [Vicia villosa]XP_058767052.1 uncharacterized protein LOC131640685 [Vicia villosa]
MSGNPARLRQGRETRTASAQRERTSQLASTRGRGRVPIQTDEAPAGSSSGSRGRLTRASFSPEVVREEEEIEEDVRHHEDDIPYANPSSGEDDTEEGYPRGPTHTSERPTIKSVNHAQKIFSLFKPQAQWFNDVVAGSGLGGLCITDYSTISHDMQGAWHKETSYFHLLVGEFTITLHDVACLLHLLIRGRLLDHSLILMVEAIEWMVGYLGMDPNMEDYECRETGGARIKFSSLIQLYENHLVAAPELEQESDELFTEYHRACALQCWFMLLVGTALFVDKSTTYIDMTYLRYFIDLTIVDQWNWGAAILGWIILYFHHIHGFAIDPAYNEGMPRAARFVLQRGNNTVGPYRVYLDHTVHDDIHWTPFTNYCLVVPFDRTALYSIWLACGTNTMVRYLPERCIRQFGRVQIIPTSPLEAAPDTITRVGLTAIFEDWAHHLVPEEYRRMVATQEWHCVKVYQRIQMLGQDALDRGIIEQGGPEAVAIMERMVSDAAGAAAYRRQRRSQIVRVIDKAKEYCASAALHQVFIEQQHYIVNTRWNPSTIGWICVNVDGAVKHNLSATCGELWEVLEGIKYAIGKGYPRIKI